MVTTGSLVNIYHLAWLQLFVCDRTFKTHSFRNFPIQIHDTVYVF